MSRRLRADDVHVPNHGWKGSSHLVDLIVGSAGSMVRVLNVSRSRGFGLGRKMLVSLRLLKWEVPKTINKGSLNQ